jgi:uncharacterized protein (TIGR02001 family)
MPRRGVRRNGWLAVLMAAACVAGSDARAQVGGSVAVVSDYRWRGVSYSSGDPVAQLSLVYDNPAGWYTGAFASSIKMKYAGDGSAHVIAFGGYAARLRSGSSWDVGMSNHVFLGASQRNFGELYGGFGNGSVRARLSYSPSYLGSNVRMAYAELSGSHRFDNGLTLFAHTGYLSASGQYVDRHRLDGRLGVATSVAGVRLQLAWDAVRFNRHDQVRTGGRARSKGGLVVSVTRPF